MASLIGYLQGSRGEVSRSGGDQIRTSVQTWSGSVNVTLHKDGSFWVTIADKHGGGGEIRITGNCDSGERHALIQSDSCPVTAVPPVTIPASN